MDFDSVAPPQPDISAIRDAILRRFDAWLNSALAEEALPQGLPPELLSAIENEEPLPPLEGQCDLYSLYAALTALTQEVKLQSRTFKQLNETLAELPSSVASILDESAAQASNPADGKKAGGSESASGAAPQLQPGKQEIELLLDLRDRFERGLNSVHEASRGLFTSRPWWRRWLGGNQAQEQRTKAVILALEKGYKLTLERMDQALQDYEVTPIACQGEKFDCHRMTAVDMEETESAAEGSVVGVYRTGYEWQGKVFRSALVKVARKPVP